MTRKWKHLAALTGGILLSASVVAAEPSPAMLANACGGCHGTNGASAGPSMPTIGGQSAIAIAEAMKGFKSGDRPATVMGRIAKGYSDAEIDAMSKYLASQKWVGVGQRADAAMVVKGKDLHDKNCKRCHLETGKEFDENATVLAGQWLEYLQIQMDDYASGARKMSEKKAERMKKLSRQELEALAQFYASQK